MRRCLRSPLGQSVVVIDAGVLREALGHNADVGDYAALAWMASSLATIAGRWAPALRATKPCGKPLTATASQRTSERDSRSIESAVGQSNTRDFMA